MPGTIVVGVDGSPPSREALRWAAEEARLRQARLVAVHAWAFIPPAPVGEPGMIPVPVGDYAGQLEAERAAAQAELEAALADAFPEGPAVEIETRLVEGDAAEVLEEEAKSADLLVVGSKGRSGIASVLLGSVSRHVIDHAPCPVVVVKAPRR
ncbi:MAG TPA: universal stress protein [Gaiellaceae bacterium]|nr:universal stress protein [Gaiellaceae bacterium]